MQPTILRPVVTPRYRAVVLLVALIGSGIGILSELYGPAPAAGSAYRLSAYVVIGGISLYQIFNNRRIDSVVIAAALVFCVFSLTEIGEATGFDSGNTVAALILISVLYVTTRESESVVPLVLGAAVTGTYTVASIILERPPLNEALTKLMVGIPGQVLVIWITWKLIQSLAGASETQARTAKIQQALATCSQALLSGRDEEPLAAALDALLDATDADYAYVDVNRINAEGHITWEIVADAQGDNVPPGPDTFFEGDYSQFPELLDLLPVGEPARIRVSDLPMPIRATYEAEGIRSELMAPIMIRGEWVGTLGYTDFWRDDAWTDIEVDGLMRAAEMIGAYWERESAREGLEELAAAKDRFIATVSHELRTPLAAVVGFSGELAQGIERYSRQEILEMVDLISSQSQEVAQLVDDLLTAERAASGNLTIQPNDLDLLSECRSIVGSLRDGVAVAVEGESTQAWADTLRTRQIIRNLLTNAQRYGGDRVRIDVSQREGTAMVVVSDDGAGVRGIDADHIFDPYYRSQNAAKHRPDSVGLGLAVARQLARMMGGDLVYRRHSGWTHFELTLPVYSAVPPAMIGSAAHG